MYFGRKGRKEREDTALNFIKPDKLETFSYNLCQHHVNKAIETNPQTLKTSS